MDADHIRNLVASINLPTSGLTGGFSLPQAVGQFLSQLTDGQHLDSTLDRFTADVGVSKVRRSM